MIALIILVFGSWLVSELLGEDAEDSGAARPAIMSVIGTQAGLSQGPLGGNPARVALLPERCDALLAFVAGEELG